MPSTLSITIASGHGSASATTEVITLRMSEITSSFR